MLAASGLIALFLALGIIALVTRTVNGGLLPAGADQLVQAVAGPTDNAACLACHSAAGNPMHFASGDTVSVSISQAAFDASVHTNLTCITCHSNILGYPHPAFSA
jgi:hypothetical protein